MGERQVEVACVYGRGDMSVRDIVIQAFIAYVKRETQKRGCLKRHTGA